MKKVFNKCFIILGVILNIQMVNAQRVALKSNLIDWATLSPNLAVEMRLNQRLTLDISAAANPFSFTIADMKATHFRFQPELRYWFNRPMARHFMGISLLYGRGNDLQKQFPEVDRRLVGEPTEHDVRHFFQLLFRRLVERGVVVSVYGCPP